MALVVNEDILVVLIFGDCELFGIIDSHEARKHALISRVSLKVLDCDNLLYALSRPHGLLFYPVVANQFHLENDLILLHSIQ